jgi:hypothetical protein
MFTLHRGTKQQKKYGVLLLIWILFFLCLSLGPDGTLYLWVYGWLESTKRFWWPSRHIVMVDISWALLASLSAHVLFLKYSQKKRIFASLILSFLIPMSLWMQGNRPFYVPQKKILSDNIYTHLAKKPGEAILQLPLSPKIAFSQEVLIQQLYHKKKLLTGHALWVDRVRPAEWDDLVLKNPLLRSLQQYELGKTFTINAPASAFTELRALGIDWVVLDKSMFTKDFSTFFHKYVELWTSILGAPDMQSETIWIWSMDGWNGTISFDAPQWNRDSSLKLGNGRTSIQGKFPPSSLWMNED